MKATMTILNVLRKYLDRMSKHRQIVRTSRLLLITLCLPIAQCVLLLLAVNVHAESSGGQLKVGLILPLSGVFAEFGEAQRNAFQLARSDYPERFSNIDFIYEDGAHDGNRTASSFNKLKNIDQIHLAFVFGVEPALIVAPLAEAAQLPTISAAQAAPASLGKKYVIRSINYSAQYSKKLIEYFAAHNLNRLGIIQAEMSFYNLLIDGLRNNLGAGQSLNIVDNYSPADTDLRSAITKLRVKRFDAVGLYLTPTQILQGFRELRSQGISVQVFGATPFQSSSLVEQANGAMDGAIYVHNIVEDDFRKRYTAKFKNDHQIPWAANAYDVALLIGEKLNEVNSRMTADEILSAFRFSGTRTGAGGSFSYRSNDLGDNISSIP